MSFPVRYGEQTGRFIYSYQIVILKNDILIQLHNYKLQSTGRGKGGGTGMG